MQIKSFRAVRGGLLHTVVAIIITSLVIPCLYALPAAAATYTWTSPDVISGGVGFVQTSTDMNGDALIIPNDEMVLEGPTGGGTVCGSHSSDFINSLGILPADQQVHIKKNGTTQDAVFGTNELIVIKPYTSSTTATHITFKDEGAGQCEPIGEKITISNTQGAKWINSTTINYIGSNFTQKSTNNGTMTLNGPASTPDDTLCSPEVLSVGDADNSFLTATSGTLTIVRLVGTGAGHCQSSTQTVPIVNKYIDNGVGSTASWMDGSNTDPSAQIQINQVGSDAQGYLNVGDIYLEPSIPNQPAIKGSTMTLNGGIVTTDSCSGNTKENTMTVNPYQTAQTATVTVYYPNPQYHAAQPCLNKTLTVGLTNLYGGAPINGNPTNNPITTTDGCIIPTTDALRWITCPILGLLQAAATAANSFIVSLLTFPVSQYFGDNMQQVFDVFRNLGVGLLVIAALFMVISQAADLEIFAAHTVRKALPRIIMAAIAISLAWPLLQFIITFFNDIGVWSGKLVLAVGSVAGTNDGGGVGAVFGGIFDGILAAIGAVAAYSILGVGGLLSLLLSAILLIGVGIFVLVIRQVVLLLCILITPLAIASFVLPGTEKLGRFWQETFLAALLMFPIIMMFLSAGAAMATITASAKIPFYSILALIFYIGPYFMLPFAFRIAGGLMERIVSWAQGTHHQTVESRLQNYRQGERQYRHQQRMEGRQGFLLPRRAGGNALSSFYRRVATRGGISLSPADWRQYGATNRKRTAQVAGKAVQEGGDISGDDVATRLASQQGVTAGTFMRDYAAEQIAGGATVREANQRARRALGAIEANFGAIGSRNATVSSFMAHAQSGTGYEGSDRGLAQLVDDGRRMVQGGLMNEADAIQAIKSNKVRADQSGIGWTSWQAALRSGNNFSDPAAANGVNAAAMGTLNDMRDSMLNGSQLGDLTRGRPEAAAAMASRLNQRIQNAAADLRAASGNAALEPARLQTLIRTLADAGSVHDYLAAASPQIGNQFANDTFGQTLNLPAITAPGSAPGSAPQAAETTTVEQALERFRSSAWMRERRREWTTPAQTQPGAFPGGVPQQGQGGNP